MLTYFFFSLYFIIDVNHFNRLRLSRELHIFSLHDTDNIEKQHRERIYNSAQSETAQYSKCFLSCRTIVIHNLTAKELEYIPKIILLREFKNYINQLWDQLPEHIKADLKVQQHRRCLYFALPSIAY